MNKEDKSLLLKDLCARLPYDPIIKVGENNHPFKLSQRLRWILEYGNAKSIEDLLDNIKPYLRPISSMTEEEKTQMAHDCYVILSLDFEYTTADMVALWNTPRVINWLLKYHFDFMGLIPKGLAIAVTEENNPYL